MDRLDEKIVYFKNYDNLNVDFFVIEKDFKKLLKNDKIISKENILYFKDSIVLVRCFERELGFDLTETDMEEAKIRLEMERLIDKKVELDEQTQDLLDKYKTQFGTDLREDFTEFVEYIKPDVKIPELDELLNKIKKIHGLD